MPSSNQESAQLADALSRLSFAMEQLQARYEATQRANRRVRLALIAVVVVLGVGAFRALPPLVNRLNEISQVVERLNPPPLEPKSAAAILASEVHGMNAKMAVMAAGMDSNMGRTGRMLPWPW